MAGCSALPQISKLRRAVGASGRRVRKETGTNSPYDLLRSGGEDPVLLLGDVFADL